MPMIDRIIVNSWDGLAAIYGNYFIYMTPYQVAYSLVSFVSLYSANA